MTNSTPRDFKPFIRRLVAAAGMMCAALPPASALAQDYPVRRMTSQDHHTLFETTRVGYRDLDLTTAQGASILLARITAASAAVCEAIESDDDHRGLRNLNDCRTETVLHAVRSVRSSQLTSLANQTFGR